MASSNSFYSAGSTTFMPSTNVDQYFASSHYIDQNGQANPSSVNTPNTFHGSAPISSNGSLANTPGSLAGRKRSRGDTHAPEDEADLSAAYDRSAGLEAIEEYASQKPFELNQMRRPSMTSRKSQRVDSAGLSSEMLAHSTMPDQARDAMAHPAVDEATLVLGISWISMDSSEARQINQAAYKKWIQNHYPMLKDVTVWFEYANEDMPAYLVKAQNVTNLQQEFYIFSHDLTEARMVTSDQNELIARLRMMPQLQMVAPGPQLRAESDPYNASQNAVNNAHAEMAAASDDEYDSWQEPNGICAAHAMAMD